MFYIMCKLHVYIEFVETAQPFYSVFKGLTVEG